MAVACATELRAICTEAQAAQTAITSTVLMRRDLRGNIICGSGVRVVRTDVLASVPNFELRPKNDRGAVLHSARVLCRYVGSLINLRADNFVSVHKHVDVARVRRLPHHTVNDVLHAGAAAHHAVHPTRARHDLAFVGVVHVKSGYRSENVGDPIGTHGLDLLWTEKVSGAAFPPLSESHPVEARLA